MEHESFEDDEVAEFINKNCVAIKVDREEREDIDKIYMSAHGSGTNGAMDQLMRPITVRLYGELNDFVPPAQRHIAFACRYQDHPSVKDLLESIGVPHPEIDLILVNGESVAFFYAVRSDDRISVYPRFRSIELSGLTRVGVAPPSPARFALDGHLGRLARHLRLAGFDTWYDKEVNDERLVAVAGREGRILLTRDLALLKRSAVTHGYYVRSIVSWRQMVEVLRRFDLLPSLQPFRRCLDCNGMLHAVSKAEVIDRLEPRTKVYYDDFYRCDTCERIYWRGSHFERLERFIELIAREASDSTGRARL